jgi:hypothetical protein
VQRVAQAARELRGERGLRLERAGGGLQQRGVEQRQQHRLAVDGDQAAAALGDARGAPEGGDAALDVEAARRSSQPFHRMITQLLTDIASSSSPTVRLMKSL